MNGEYVVRSFLPNGVFLPCEQGLDFWHQLNLIVQSINRSRAATVLYDVRVFRYNSRVLQSTNRYDIYYWRDVCRDDLAARVDHYQ